MSPCGPRHALRPPPQEPPDTDREPTSRSVVSMSRSSTGAIGAVMTTMRLGTRVRLCPHPALRWHRLVVWWRTNTGLRSGYRCGECPRSSC